MSFSTAYTQYVIAVNVYIVGAVCAFGIAGNVLSIVVLGRDRTIRRTTAFLMQMLAVADASFLISCLFFVTLSVALSWTDWFPAAVRRVWPYVYLYSYPIASITGTVSVWMVVVLTADRYIAICRPLHAAQYSTMPRLRRAVAVLWVLAVAFCLPRVFEVEVVEVEMGHVSPSVGRPLNGSDVVSDNSTMADTLVNSTQNSTLSESRLMPAVQPSAMGKSDVYFFVYTMCISIVVRFLLPLAALAFFNHCLMRALRESFQLRHRSATDGGTERQHTWMLVVVVIVFFVCYLPNIILRFYAMLARYTDVHYSLILMDCAIKTSNLMIIVNSSVNVVIYCFMGKQFRAILLHMFSCGARGGSEGSRRPSAPCTNSISIEQSQSGPESHGMVNLAVDVH